MENLWSDVDLAIRKGIHLMNFATESVSAREIARVCGAALNEKTDAAPVRYDMKTPVRGTTWPLRSLSIHGVRRLLRPWNGSWPGRGWRHQTVHLKYRV